MVLVVENFIASRAACVPRRLLSAALEVEGFYLYSEEKGRMKERSVFFCSTE